MRNQEDCTAKEAKCPEVGGQMVTLFVPEDHRLLQLKQALDWEGIREVMVKHWRAAGKNVEGGRGRSWPVWLYVPLLVLMCVKRLKTREMEAYVSENVVARVFLGMEEEAMGWVRDHSNIARAQEALGAAGWEEVNQMVVKEAQRLGFGDPKVLSSDTTVQAPEIGYPHEAGILKGVAQRILRAMKKLKERGEEGAQGVIKQAKEVIKRAKEYHLFAKGKEAKQEVLERMVEQTEKLRKKSQEVLQQVGEAVGGAIQRAVEKVQQMVGVSGEILVQVRHWLETGQVAANKILHAGITGARAIVKGKAGQRVEFGFKWLINRIGGGYVFGKVVPAYADERQMPVEGLKNYREVFGAEATPQMSVYDRGGHGPKTVKRLKQAGVEKVGIQPRGKAAWSVGEEDQSEVLRQRGMTEGSIGTLKSRAYCFNKTRERSNQAVAAAGQRGMVCLNLNTLMRDLVEREREASRAAA